MKRALTMAAAIWLASFGVGFAQGVPAPGMGVTSPLGTLGSQASSQSPAIPLGATELEVNGISPLVMPCSGSAASNSAFDGGGSPSGSTTNCGSSTSAGSSGIAGSASIESSAQTMGSAGGSGIPLGSTGLGTPGESPTIAIPAPSVSTGSCSGGSSLGTSAASGLAPTNSC